MKDRFFGAEKFRGLLLAGSVAMVVEFLMGLSDSVVIGHLLGEESLAGLNLISPVMTAVTFCAGLIGVGMGINYALEMGRCNRSRAAEYFSQALWTALGVGGLLLLGMVLFGGAFVGFMSPSPSVAADALAYWRWYAPAALLEPIAILFVNMAMADGDSRLCFITYCAQITVNLTVSLLLMRVIGISGCALGTVIADAAAIAILSTHFLSKTNTFRLVRRFSLADTGRIVRSSFGDSSSFLCSAGLFFVLNKYVIVRFGSGLLPVLSTVIVTIGFLEVFNGIGNALSPIVTVYAGECNYPAVRRMMSIANRWAIGEGLALSVFLVIFPGVVARLVGIDDPDLVRLSETAVRLTALGLVGQALVGLYNSYYIFISREPLSIALTALSGFIAPVVLVLTLGRLGLNGVWSALASGSAVAILVFSAFVVFRHGKGAFPLLLPRDRDAKIAMFDLGLDEDQIADASRRVAALLKANGIDETRVLRASLMTEEVLMAVKDRNAGRRVLAEVTLDLNEGVQLTMRDDGVIFDITDADQGISSLRTFLVASVMEHQPGRMNLVTTGFNRNVFRF